MLQQSCGVSDLYLLLSRRVSRSFKCWDGPPQQRCSASPLHWLFGDAAACEKEARVKWCLETGNGAYSNPAGCRSKALGLCPWMVKAVCERECWTMNASLDTGLKEVGTVNLFSEEQGRYTCGSGDFRLSLKSPWSFDRTAGSCLLICQQWVGRVRRWLQLGCQTLFAVLII